MNDLAKVRLLHKRIIILALISIMLFTSTVSYAAGYFDPDQNLFVGVPKITIQLSNLDTSGDLIYCGVDIGIFYDPEHDGTFVIMPDDSKVMRYVTTNTNLTFDIGALSTFQKGVVHKVAMRTLYVPTGTKQEPIIIADQNNGFDGWVTVPNSTFKPSFFMNGSDSPYVKHNPIWDAYRLNYNDLKVAAGQSEMVREQSVFWPGEELVMNVELAEPVYAVKATIIGETDSAGNPYSVTMKDYSISIAEGEPNVYTYGGSIKDDMLDKWGNSAPKELTVKIEVLDNSSNTLESLTTKIIMDNRDPYFRSKLI